MNRSVVALCGGSLAYFREIGYPRTLLLLVVVVFAAAFGWVMDVVTK
jgi:hypothetical protein